MNQIQNTNRNVILQIRFIHAIDSIPPHTVEKLLSLSHTHLEVHCELIFRNPAELQDDPIEVFRGDKLEVLDAGHRDSTVKVQHVRSNLLSGVSVPHTAGRRRGKHTKQRQRHVSRNEIVHRGQILSKHKQKNVTHEMGVKKPSG